PEKRSVEQNQNLLKLRAKTFFRHPLISVFVLDLAKNTRFIFCVYASGKTPVWAPRDHPV
ncbi:MAG: hypothetical protein AAFW73_21650, partial [Bacteroidota bacterium]